MVNFYSCFVSVNCNATVQNVVGKLLIALLGQSKYVSTSLKFTCIHSFYLGHINHIRKEAGVNHVGIGGDFNGVNSFPEGLEDESKYPNLFAALIEDGSLVGRRPWETSFWKSHQSMEGGRKSEG